MDAAPRTIRRKVTKMDDLISRQATIAEVKEAYENDETLDGYEYRLQELPSAQPESQWIPIKWHECTDEEREKYGFAKDIVYVFDNEMPNDEQEILVTTSHGYVEKDVCYINDGFSLDSGYDWIEDIKAWRPLPEPYIERRKE